MSGYKLSSAALDDLTEIVANRLEYFGLDSALELRERILEACERLAATPGLGHRRGDLTRKAYFFYTLDPYLIVYSRHVDPLPILAVLHSARNVRKLLTSRLRQ